MTPLTRRLLLGGLVVVALGIPATLVARHCFVTVPSVLQDLTDLRPEPDVPLGDLARRAGLGTDPIPGGRLVVHKAALTLSFYAGERLLKTYPVALGFGDLGPKVKRDDGRTPEGTLRIVQRVRKPHLVSGMDLWMRLDYPLPQDAERGLATGLIDRAQHDAIVRAHERGLTPPQDTALGGGVGIHLGGLVSRRWTAGCIALREADGVEIYDQTRLGTTVEVGQ
jgi:hypothetical protein